jgi:hypothetical protein
LEEQAKKGDKNAILETKINQLEEKVKQIVESKK